MLYMTVWAIKHRTFVNNFAYETAEINIEVKHLHKYKTFIMSKNDMVKTDTKPVFDYKIFFSSQASSFPILKYTAQYRSLPSIFGDLYYIFQ